MSFLLLFFSHDCLSAIPGKEAWTWSRQCCWIVAYVSVTYTVWQIKIALTKQKVGTSTVPFLFIIASRKPSKLHIADTEVRHPQTRTLYTVRVAQSLTISMMRWPQTAHFSAVCWKPEYCKTQYYNLESNGEVLLTTTSLLFPSLVVFFVPPIHTALPEMVM